MSWLAPSSSQGTGAERILTGLFKMTLIGTSCSPPW